MGIGWLQHLDVAGTIIMFITALIAIVGSSLGNKCLVILFPIGITINFIFRWFEKYYFYELVKCPSCKSKLNYFKNGNRVSSEQAWGQLRRGYGCRVCKWKPKIERNV